MEHLYILEDFDEFYLYPWGRVVFKETLKHFKKMAKNTEATSERKPSGYHLAGFPFVVLAFIFESIPLFNDQNIVTRNNHHFYERVLNWVYTGGASWKILASQVFDNPQVSINTF